MSTKIAPQLFKNSEGKDCQVHKDFTDGNIILYGDDNVGFKVHDYYLKTRYAATIGFKNVHLHTHLQLGFQRHVRYCDRSS